MTSASHQPTMYQSEIDEIKSNPLSAKAKKARQKLRLIAINDSDVWRELRKEMRETRLITNDGIREALNASMLDNMVDKLIASGAVTENPHQVRKNAEIEKGVLEKFGSDDFTSNWRSLKTFVCSNKSYVAPSIKSGDMRKLGERGRLCQAKQISQTNVHSKDTSSASTIFRSKNELSAIKSEDSLLDARKKSNSSTNVGRIRRPLVDSGITRDKSLRTLLGIALATTTESNQCLDEISSIPSSRRNKSREASSPSKLAGTMCQKDDDELYVPFGVTSSSCRHFEGVKEDTAQNYRRGCPKDDDDLYVPFCVTSSSCRRVEGVNEGKAYNYMRGTAMRTRRKIGSSPSVKAASVVLQNNFC